MTKLLTCLHVLPKKKKKKKKTPEELCNYRPTGYRHACMPIYEQAETGEFKRRTRLPAKILPIP